MKWVVLSDLHFGTDNPVTQGAREKLIAFLKDKAKNTDFILVTGDCMFRHNTDEENIKQIVDYLEKVCKACNVRRDKIFFTAGNHDINRNDFTDRKKLIKDYRKGKNEELPSLSILRKAYTEFDPIVLHFYGRQYKPFECFEVGNYRVINIDSCLLSIDDNDMGKLAVNFNALNTIAKKIKNDDKVNIVITHFGVEWLQYKEARHFQHWLQDHNVKMVFCGHSHMVGMSVLAESIPEGGEPNEGILQFTCGTSLATSYSNPAFFIAECDKLNNLRVELYEFGLNEEWRIADGLLRSFPKGIFLKTLNNKTDIPSKVYNNIYDAYIDMASDVKASHELAFFGLRGATFLEGKNRVSDAVTDCGLELKSRILVSDPYNKNIGNRFQWMTDIETQEDLENQWREVYEDIKMLRTQVKRKKTSYIRFHLQPLFYRFIITDTTAYFGFYRQEMSRKTKMYRYNKDTAMYANLKMFFDNSWNNAKTNFSEKIPERCSFLSGQFEMKPSVVLNLTDKCDMDCRYCPKGGENLQRVNDLCDIEKIKILLEAYSEYCNKKQWYEKKVLRITGGEPLLVPDRVTEVFLQAKKVGFQKIVFCTNGVHLIECYQSNKKVWDSVKNVLLLKISLDTLNRERFKELTGTDHLFDVTEAIEYMSNAGFKIELNLVATKTNVNDIKKVFKYARDKRLIGVKVLTMNDFGGRVKQENVEKELNELLDELRQKNTEEVNLYVHNNKGINMKRLILDGCQLTIVDHNNQKDSITPRRTYSDKCKSCKYYPESVSVKNGQQKACATGIMSLTLRADGNLSYCRLKTEDGISISDKSPDEINKILLKELSYFSSCYHYEVHEED